MERRTAPIALIAFCLAMIAACAATALFVANLAIRNVDNGSPVGHRWLHDELNLSAKEEQALEAIEINYQQQRGELQREFEATKHRLATILSSTDAYGVEVTHAVHEIHRVHGALQELAIRHYYDMLAVLPAEKQARLRSIAVQALSEPE